MAGLMISLRAICISRKKLSLLLLFLMLPAMLAASPFRTAVVSSDEIYTALVSDVLSVLSGEVTSRDAVNAYEAKIAAKARREREVTVSGLRQKESFSELESFDEEDVPEAWDGVLTLETVEVTFSDTEREFLLSGDADAFRFLMQREDIDLLIAAEAHEDGMMMESRVFANGVPVHSNLYISSDDSGEFNSLLEALLPFVKSPETVIVHVDVPSVVSVSIDGNPVSIIRSTVVMEEGEHLISFTSPVYETCEMAVNAENGMTIAPDLVPVPSSRLFISAVPYDSVIYFQGLRTGDHLIENADVPFQITAMHEGFSPLLIQSRVPMDSISLQLRPEWMGEENIVERAKGRFYTNLLSTLVSFGCYVASQSLAGIYTEADIAPAVTLFAGVSFVQLFELFDSMFDYYQAARLGI